MPGNRNALAALLLTKVESTSGTDAAPTAAADTLQILQPFVPDSDFAFKTPRDKLVAGAALTASYHLTPQGPFGMWNYEVQVRGSRTGAAFSGTVKPDIDPVMVAGGFSSVFSGGAGAEVITYKPVAPGGQQTMTQYYYQDGVLRKLLGCVADSITISWSAGTPVLLKANTKGLYPATFSDAAIPASPTFGGQQPPLAANATLNIDGFTTSICRDFSCTITNEVPQRPSVLGTGGLAAFYAVRARKIEFTATVEEELNATKNFESLIRNGTQSVLNWVLGGTQYNKSTFTAGGMHLHTVKPADDAGLLVIKMSGILHDSSPAANDAITWQHS